MVSMSLPIFSLDGIPDPWAEVFDGLTNYSLLVCLGAGTFEEKGWIIMHRVHWLHWLAKLRFNPQHQSVLSIPRNNSETYKPLGELYYSALKLSEAITDSEFDASVLFLNVALEANVESPGIPLNQKYRKTKSKTAIKQENDALKGERNPFDCQKSPATHQLIKASLEKIRKSEEVNSLWEEFLKKRRKLRPMIDDPQFAILTENDEGQLRCPLPGGGRGTTALRLPQKFQTEVYAEWARKRLSSLEVPENLRATHLDVISHCVTVLSNPIGLAVLTLLGDKDHWEGTASQFLSEIKQIKPEISGGDGWPKTPESLGKRWESLIPKLQKVGIDIKLTREGKGGIRLVLLSRLTVL
jgi:hypothetical protein